MTYFARDRHVYVTDGPWEARLTEDQCDQLLCLWEAANAPTLFNSLWEACQAVGYCPWHAKPARTHIRLVSENPTRRMLQNACADLGITPALSAVVVDHEPNPPNQAA